MKKWYLLTTISLVLLSLSLMWVAGCGDDSSSTVATAKPSSPIASVAVDANTVFAAKEVNTTGGKAILTCAAGTFTSGTLYIAYDSSITPPTTVGGQTVTPKSNVFHIYGVPANILVSGKSFKVTFPTNKEVEQIVYSFDGKNWAFGSDGATLTISTIPCWALRVTVGTLQPTSVPPTAPPTATATSSATATAVPPTATATTSSGSINVTIN